MRKRRVCVCLSLSLSISHAHTHTHTHTHTQEAYRLRESALRTLHRKLKHDAAYAAGSEHEEAMRRIEMRELVVLQGRCHVRLRRWHAARDSM